MSVTSGRCFRDELLQVSVFQVPESDPAAGQRDDQVDLAANDQLKSGEKRITNLSTYFFGCCRFFVKKANKCLSAYNSKFESELQLYSFLMGSALAAGSSGIVSAMPAKVRSKSVRVVDSL
jgi:hypothetical protein